MTTAEILIIIGIAIAVILEIVIIIKQSKNSSEKLQKQLDEAQKKTESAVRDNLKYQLDGTRDALTGTLGILQNSLNSQLDQSRKSNEDKLDNILDSIDKLEKTNEAKLDNVRSTISEGLKDLREENTKKLDEIRGTVDEKLQTTLEKRISESFQTVSNQLEQVYKSMGEMQNLATDVGGLKKVLTGVKTRGILGEVQLGAILSEILAPEQYETNVITVPGSKERVEFAVKLPGNDGSPVLLPIDSKFPGDRYAQLLAAQESGDKAAVDEAYKALERIIKDEAKDIAEKYISVPYTTAFGIMFLPFEGLYAEVVNRGLLEQLQREYKVNIAGPSTMAAYLNSLQMGFRTLAIQKRSSEVWEVLGAVKTEFDTFEGVMIKMQDHLRQTTADLDKLAGTRTRAIKRKLKDIETLDLGEASKILELSEAESKED